MFSRGSIRLTALSTVELELVLVKRVKAAWHAWQPTLEAYFTLDTLDTVHPTCLVLNKALKSDEPVGAREVL